MRKQSTGNKHGDEIVSKAISHLNRLIILVAIVAVPAVALGQLQNRDSENVRRAFRQSIAEARKSTVRVLCDGKSKVLGAVVDAKGLVVTKASELQGQITCRTYNDEVYEAEIIGTDRDEDLALLKLKMGKKQLPAVKWLPSGSPPVGSFLATTGLDELPLAIGVLSVGPRRIQHQRGFLGVGLDEADAGPVINEVIPQSAAASAGLKLHDVIMQVNGTQVQKPMAMIRLISRLRPGDEVKLKVKRAEEELDFRIRLGTPEMNGDRADRFSRMNALGGKLSTRRAGFPVALQHDTVLAPDQCGGPLVDLDGNVVGINIARAGRVNSYAVPADVVQKLVTSMAKVAK